MLLYTKWKKMAIAKSQSTKKRIHTIKEDACSVFFHGVFINVVDLLDHLINGV